MNVLRTLRNHWKKSIVISGIGAYGLHYARKKYHEALILEAYCIEAKKYGDAAVRGAADRPRRVTVFLNPAASRGKGKALFEKNVAPLLHLAGLEVTLVLTEYEGQAKRYMDVLDNTDAILVAGGNGTLSEVVTGLLRRADQEQFSRVPLGVIPLGKHNTMAKSLCPPTSCDPAFMNEMTMSVIRGNVKPVDVLHVKGDDDKSVYAMLGVDWGLYSDTELRKKKYWYFGPLKDRLALVISSLRYWPPAHHAALSYVRPCAGCSRCYVPPPPVPWKWWHILIAPKREVALCDYAGVVNDDCGLVASDESIALTQLTARTSNHPSSAHSPTSKAVELTTIDADLTRMEFIRRGLDRLEGGGAGHQSGNGEEAWEGKQRVVMAREFTLTPAAEPTTEQSSPAAPRWLYIDNEQFELKAVTCRVLQNKLNFFFSNAFTVPIDSITGRMDSSAAH